MGMTVGFLVLFALGASWACDARELPVTFDVSVLQITRQESEGKVKASEEVGRNENVCQLCEEFAAEAFEYLQENKTQTEIVERLHQTCSRMAAFEQQCTTLVDYYVPLFFLELESVQPEVFCQKVNLCEQMVITSLPLDEDKCEACHRVVAEIILKLKDPDTELEIIELLLKACNAVEKDRVKKCKTLVFEYGPLIISNAEKFLEKTDMCTAIHACNSPSADIRQAFPVSNEPTLSVL
ncbi:hypothetical protein U1Q18_043542 [Sarracenia purpurea var. burkii]